VTFEWAGCLAPVWLGDEVPPGILSSNPPGGCVDASFPGNPALILFHSQKSILFFMYSAHYCRPVLNRIGTCQQIVVKFFSTKFYKNSFSGYRVVTCGQMDRQTDIAKLVGVSYCKLSVINAAKTDLIKI
jgi:hypothetical protein